MKKFFSLVLTTVITLSLVMGLYGCGGTEYHYEINWDVDLSKPITINGLYPETSLTSFGTDDTAKIIADTTGYTVNYREVTDGTADNEINSILSTQEEYHILKLTEAQYHPYLEQGTFLELNELLERTESGRKLYDLIDLMDYGWDATTYTDNEGNKHIYGIPDFGYCVMEDSALIWNVDHLIKVGYYELDAEGNKTAKTPKTIAEFTDALTKCQEMFGSNSSYHAFDIPGENSVIVSPLVSAFGVPLEFYVDENGKISQYIFSDRSLAYAEYMHEFYNNGILSKAWNNGDASQSCNKFANELCSVTFLPYWYVTPLIKAIAAKNLIPQKLGIDNTDYRAVHDGCVVWTTRVQGDGTHGSAVQSKPMLHGGDDGVSYYTVIPAYMAEYAVYIIDFLGKKLEYFDQFYGGIEGTHYIPCETPAGAKDFYEDGDYSYQEFETYAGADSVIYLRPYEYSYRVGEQKADGTYDKKTVKGGGKWVKLTDRYLSNIVDNSQYCNGTNRVAANVLFHLRETGYDAWQVTVPMDDSIITNPMTMAPPFKNWSVVSILSRTQAKRGLSSAIMHDNPAESLAITRESMWRKKVNKEGTAYPYWSEDIINEMTNWYINVKLNRE